MIRTFENAKLVSVWILIILHTVIFGVAGVYLAQKFLGGYDLTWWTVFSPIVFLFIFEAFIGIGLGFTILIVQLVTVIFDSLIGYLVDKRSKYK